MTKRAPTGAAVLQPRVTTAITEAVLAELTEHGYGRVSMEAVAKRAGVGKSALYRRWPSEQDMVIAALAELSVPAAEVPDTGSLRGDLRSMLQAVHDWLADPRIAAICRTSSRKAGATVRCPTPSRSASASRGATSRR